MPFAEADMFRRIAITEPYFFDGEADMIVEMLRSERFDYIHIRKPGADTAAIRSLIERIPKALRQRLNLHDAFDIAIGSGVGGVHLNSRNPLPPEGWRFRISSSCHSIEECTEAATKATGHGYQLDYVTLSPIYNSFSKPGYLSPFSKDNLREYLASDHPLPTIALGGVDDTKEAELKSLGFDGCAMLSSAWRHEIPLNAFSLQFITNPTSVDDAINQTRQVLAGGCRWVQLRWKDSPITQLTEAAGMISQLCRVARAIFLLDDHVELVKSTHADGVHLGKNDMPVDEARKLLGPTYIIGATANTPDDIFAAASAGADYIGYGPFRFTTTKKNLSPVLGLEGYAEARRFRQKHGLTLPLVAIGGIENADIPSIIHAGADGVAVSGTILRSHTPTQTTRDILHTLNIL